MSERTENLTDDALAQFLRSRSADAEFGLLDDIVRAVSATPQDRPWLGLRPIRLTGRGLLIVAALLLATIGAIAVGSGLLLPRPNLGIFASVAGRIVYEGDGSVAGIENGIWGLDPTSSDPATTVQLTSELATPLGWSADGTRLLIQKGGENLSILHADGSETLVVEQPWGLYGAAISPDGSRVAFGGLTQPDSEYGGLFAVDADGGQAELLWEWPDPANSLIVRFPTFSPDGTQIAFALDNIDSVHTFWVINADGTDAHQILDPEGFGPGWVRGLAWSPAGDRIALAFAGAQPGIYTFAPDGSNFARPVDTEPPMTIGGTAMSWSPDGSLLAYMTGCDGANSAEQVTGCMLVIAHTDGSVARTFVYGMAGPWHPGSVARTSTSSPTPLTAGYGYPPEVCGYLNRYAPLVWAAKDQHVRQALGDEPSESLSAELARGRPGHTVSDDVVGDIYVQEGVREAGWAVCVITDTGTVHGFAWPAEWRPPSR